MYRALDKWLGAYLFGAWRRRVRRARPVTDVLFCICDHFEPHHAADHTTAASRVARWCDAYPARFSQFRDADGRPPRHTFFYPIEQYDAGLVESVAGLCRQGYGELELHLHHAEDTPASLAEKLTLGRQRLATHGGLAADADGQLRFGFVHGDWALDNSHPQRRFCGVSDELSVLLDAGCYADFTMPSAPDPTQTRMINSIYYARPSPQPKSHDRGSPVTVGKARDEGMLMVQGPLGFAWHRRKWGILPRLENGELSGANPPSPARFRRWLQLAPRIGGLPQWAFVKLHAHGAVPDNSTMLLGEPMAAFHRYLTDTWQDRRHRRLHYVTARELVNIVCAAAAGRSGDPGHYRDFRYQPRLQAL